MISPIMQKGIILGIASLMTFTCAVQAVDQWPAWRGAEQNGATSAKAPAALSLENNLAWKAELPGRGCSTPIVSGGRIFLTTEIGDEDGVLAFDLSGKELWRATLGDLRPGRGQRVGSGANSSPVTDGKTVFAYFKSGNFAALDFEGKVLWKKNLEEQYGEDKLWWDKGTSPVLAGGNVVVAIMHTEGDSYLVSFDKKTGKEVWKTRREYETEPESGDAYTTPQVVGINGVETIVSWGANHLTGHNAKNGKLLWEVDGFNPDNNKYWRVIASTAISGDVCLVPYARGNAIAGIKLDTKSSKPQWLWKREELGSDSSTPIAFEGKAIILKDSGPTRGRVTCVDLETGKTLWESELPRSASKFYASPILANDTLYIAREDGTVFAARVTSSGLKDVEEIALQEAVIASPAAVGGKVLIRSDQHLYCFAK